MERVRTFNVWPWAIATALAFVVSAYVVMIQISLRHPSAPVAGDHYAVAERYDEVLARRKAAEALGWNVEVVACPRGPLAEQCRVALDVRDGHGQPLLGMQGTLDARRSDDVSLDRSATLHERGDGRYTADLALTRGGFYIIEVRLEGPAGSWLGSRQTLIGQGGS